MILMGEYASANHDVIHRSAEPADLDRSQPE